MGCGAAKAIQTTDSVDANGIRKAVPKSVAFEVNADPTINNQSPTNQNESLIIKHPPKRLLRLEEQQTTPRTAEEILEKQRLAEQRRRSILDEKVLKSKQLQAKLLKRKNSNESGQDATSNASNDANSQSTTANQSTKEEEQEKEVKNSSPDVSENKPETPILAETSNL